MPTGPPHLVGLASDDHGDIVDAGSAQGANLPVDEGQPANLHEALGRFAGCAVQPRALARGEDDPTHAIHSVLARDRFTRPELLFG